MKKTLLLLAFAFLFPALSAEEQNEWIRARIEFSDRTVLDGEIKPIGERPLIVNTNPNARSVNRRLRLSDVIHLSQKVEKTTMGEPWMYAESGRDELLKLEGKAYPLFEFKTELLLTTGEVVSGHIIAFPFRFRKNAEAKYTRKMFLYRHLKGELNHNVWISRIKFPGSKPVHGKGITGRVEGLGKLQKVIALDPERKVPYDAVIDERKNSFELQALLPAKYELFVMTDEAVIAGFAGNDPVPETLEKNFRLADDFFNDRRILKLGGGRILVYKQRADFHNAAKHVAGGYVWHLEIWNWHTAGEEWKIDSRNTVLRVKQKGKEKPRKFYLSTKLARVVPGTDTVITKKLFTEEDLNITPPEKNK